MKVDNTFLSNNFLDSSSESKKVNNSSANLFSDMLSSVSDQENSVFNMQQEYLSGERDDIENILIENQKLSLEFNFALQVRNNLVNTLKELTTMQI